MVKSLSGWVRLWHDMPTDPKWRTIAKKSGQSISEVIAVYVFLMVNASANASERQRTPENESERGKIINWCSEDVGAALNMDAEQIDAILTAMQGKVLEGDKLTGWNKRQPKRERDDAGSAERARAWRDKQKENSKPERQRTPANAKKRQRTPKNTSDTDTDTDTDTDKNTTAGAVDGEKPIILLPTNRYNTKGEEFAVTQKMFDEWFVAYPAVDIFGQLRTMRAWCLNNEAKRKTKKGMPSFINRWLAKEQNKGPQITKYIKPGDEIRNKPVADDMLDNSWADKPLFSEYTNNIIEGETDE